MQTTLGALLTAPVFAAHRPAPSARHTLPGLSSSTRLFCNRQLCTRQLRQSRLSWRQSRPSHASQVTAAGKAVAGKLISSTEIPAFIPRQDLMDQLHRWAQMEAAEEGAKSFGLPMKVAPIYKDGNLLWGFTVGIVRDGVTVTSLSVKFDDETVVKRAWVGRGPDGFPAMEGSSQEIAGKNFEIRKTDDNPVDEQLRSVIRTFCQSLVSAINKYYAFGSAFSDDST